MIPCPVVGAAADESRQTTKERDMDTMERQRELIDIAEDLISDETYDLPDGRLLRLRVEQDEQIDLRDLSDCYGYLEWITPGKRQAERPATFDGAARKVWVGGDCFWWQPPSDISSDPEAVRTTRRALVDLLENGIQTVTVEVCEGADAYGRPIVQDIMGLGGVEWYSDQDYRVDVVTDLLMELGV